MATAPQPVPVPVLKLADVCDLIETGDALLCSGARPFSRVIQRRTGSPYSHVAIACQQRADDGRRELWAYEAMEGEGVFPRPFREYLKADADAGCSWEWFRLTDGRVSREAMREYAVRHVGSRYATAQLGWAYLVPDWLKRCMGWPANIQPGRFYCSEYYADAYRYGLYKGGVQDPLPFAPSETSPAMVATYPFLERVGVLVP